MILYNYKEVGMVTFLQLFNYDTVSLQLEIPDVAVKCEFDVIDVPDDVIRTCKVQSRYDKMLLPIQFYPLFESVPLNVCLQLCSWIVESTCGLNQ